MRDASRHVFYLFLFKERDKSGSGYINYEQLEEIYRVYQVCWTIFLFVFFLHRNWSRSIKVDLDDTKAGKVQDRTGRPGRPKLNILSSFFLIKTWSGATSEPGVQGPLVARTLSILPRRHICWTSSAAPWERPSSSSVPGSPGKVCRQPRRRRRKLNLS